MEKWASITSTTAASAARFSAARTERTGKDYEYRRLWICQMERRLAGLFGVDIGWHAELCNHLHLILRTRPDVVETWSDEEVARRSLTINRLVHSTDGETIRPVTDKEIKVELAKPDRATELRERLSSVSYFMKALCEHIARRANREDACRGNLRLHEIGNAGLHLFAPLLAAANL